MEQDVLICKCKKVYFSDVEHTLNQMDHYDVVKQSFTEVQSITHCSTGCGGCHDKIMDAISEIMMK